MNSYIIDASIAVKWLFEESNRQASIRYLQADIRRIAPDLILIECVNAIRRKVLLKQITQKEGDEGFQILDKWKDELLDIFPAVNLLKQAYFISKELNQHPVPDCLYLALAEREKCSLVTADKKFYNRVHASVYAPLIVWVDALQ